MINDYGFMSERWHGLKSIQDLNGSRNKYRGLTVDVIDVHTRKKIGRMPLGAVLRKFQ